MCRAYKVSLYGKGCRKSLAFLLSPLSLLCLFNSSRSLVCFLMYWWAVSLSTEN
jgi:hypothetical protein